MHKQQDGFHRFPFLAPRFWSGMRLRSWMRLLARHRYQVHPYRYAMAGIITGFAATNSALYRVQELVYGRRIRETKIECPPVFIIGHWRSGTTWLHELMACDDRLAVPSTYECFAPHHFLISGCFAPKILSLFAPSKRPMDNMDAGFHLPQEEEFAMAALGAPTPYLRIAFPNHPPPYLEFLNMTDVDPMDLETFRQSLTWFLQVLTFNTKKQYVFKSPPHMGRIEVLSEMFPGAKFIHITRDPLEVFPSTRRLWMALDRSQGLQLPRFDRLDEYVFNCFEKMYTAFEEQRSRLYSQFICDVRYEELVDDPIGQIERIYDVLELGDCGHFAESLKQFVVGRKDYQPHPHKLDDETAQQVIRRWGPFMKKYGYQPTHPSERSQQSSGPVSKG